MTLTKTSALLALCLFIQCVDGFRHKLKIEDMRADLTTGGKCKRGCKVMDVNDRTFDACGLKTDAERKTIPKCAEWLEKMCTRDDCKGCTHGATSPGCIAEASSAEVPLNAPEADPTDSGSPDPDCTFPGKLQSGEVCLLNGFKCSLGGAWCSPPVTVNIGEKYRQGKTALCCSKEQEAISIPEEDTQPSPVVAPEIAAIEVASPQTEVDAPPEVIAQPGPDVAKPEIVAKPTDKDCPQTKGNQCDKHAIKKGCVEYYRCVGKDVNEKDFLKIHECAAHAGGCKGACKKRCSVP